MSDDIASSDMLTSLSVISFCIAAVLILCSVMNGYLSSVYSVNRDDLKDQLNSLIEEAAIAATEVSYDGYRYLRFDWKIKIKELTSSSICSDCNFAMIEIRCYGQDNRSYMLKNIDDNIEFELQGSLPFYYIYLNMKRPGQIVATVGV
ncbi:MAG TPA: hypothetical protein ENN25_04420 [Euryarchaeota archaeon]|nr:hypothetical protein [Euryarchaeota archaeon]